MRKVGKNHSTSPSPAPPSVSGSTAIGGQAMKRAGSGGKCRQYLEMVYAVMEC